MTETPLDAISISELGRKRNVSKQAIHQRVKPLIEKGLIQTWPGPNRSVLVSESAFDFAVGATGDPVKEAAAASAAVLRGGAEPVVRPSAGSDIPSLPSFSVDGETPAYRDAKARQAYYDAELKRLSFERESGQLYRVEEVDAALARIAGAVTSVAKGLVSRADEGAEALEKGMPSYRRWLVQVGEDICRALAAEWRVLADDSGGEEDQQEEPRPEADGES